jgi:hypothetical protein
MNTQRCKSKSGFLSKMIAAACGAPGQRQRLRQRDKSIDISLATAMRRMPELSAFDSAKSMIREFPPKYTAGLARTSISSVNE